MSLAPPRVRVWLPEPGLGIALAVSLLIHLIVLAQLGLPRIDRRVGGSIPLSVVLGQAAIGPGSAPQRPEPPAVVPAAAARIVGTKAAPSVSASAPKRPPSRIEPRLPGPEFHPGGAADSPPIPGQTATVVRRSVSTPSSIRPGQVSVLLVLDPAGSVDQIIWGTLPALDDAAFLEIEERIRSRRYPEGEGRRTVNEVIDVFALLRRR